jgi:hypothetical protein
MSAVRVTLLLRHLLEEQIVANLAGQPAPPLNLHRHIQGTRRRHRWHSKCVHTHIAQRRRV